MKTQGEQVDCMARSGLYHSRPASITSYTNELNTKRPKQTDKTQIIVLSSVGSSILTRAERDVQDWSEYLKFFNASWGFIVTWYKVTFYGAIQTPYPVTAYTMYSYISIRMHFVNQYVHFNRITVLFVQQFCFNFSIIFFIMCVCKSKLN